jgi:hypothetical protein
MGSRQESLSRSAEPVAALVLPIAVWMVVYDEDHHHIFKIPQIHLHHVPDPRQYVVRASDSPNVRLCSRSHSRIFDGSQAMVTFEAPRSRRRDRLEDPLAATRCAGSMSVKLGSLRSALLVRRVSKPERHRCQAESGKASLGSVKVWNRLESSSRLSPTLREAVRFIPTTSYSDASCGSPHQQLPRASF